MGDEVRHLGTIEGREIPGTDAPVPPVARDAPVAPVARDAPVPPVARDAPVPPVARDAPVPPVARGATVVPPVASYPPPAGPPVAVARHDLVRHDGPPPGRAAQARAEVAEAFHDIRDAHRRGPKANSRPLPRWVERLAWVLDDAIAIPATGGRRVGIDGFITIVPGVGDAVGVALSMVVVTAGVLAGASWPTIVRMLLNVAFEGVVGLIPFAGVVFDMAYKANDRNVRLIEADLADRRATRRSSLGVIAALLFTTIAGVVMMFVLSVLGITLMVWFAYRLIHG